MLGLPYPIVGLLGVFLSACTTLFSPFDESVFGRGDPRLTPASVVADSRRKTGASLLWGGRIAEVRALDKSIEVSVLAFPLDRNGEPRINENFQGRFVARYGYNTDSVNYLPGKRITVFGQVLGVREDAVGSTAFWVPIVEPIQTQLWDDSAPAPRGLSWWPSLNVNFGMMGGF